MITEVSVRGSNKVVTAACVGVDFVLKNKFVYKQVLPSL
jgi:hypothetical protein